MIANTRGALKLRICELALGEFPPEENRYDTNHASVDESSVCADDLSDSQRTSQSSITTAKGERRSLCRGLLLQSEMGLRRRVHSPLQEEPLPDPQETNRDGPNPERDRGQASIPRY